MGTDVVELIMSDHREVERLFEILKTQPDQRMNALPVLSALLVAHSRAEEAEVYPVAREEVGAVDQIAESQEEHLEAEHLLEQLQAVDPTDKKFGTLLQQVIDAVSHHVEEEERSVLPAMQEQLEQSRREQLGEAFARSRADHLGDMPGELGKEDLAQQAGNVGMSGTTSMGKQELRDELRKRADG